jgi:predicted DNA-binding antitoxin AbrB/MazE fold protein
MSYILKNKVTEQEMKILTRIFCDSVLANLKEASNGENLVGKSLAKGMQFDLKDGNTVTINIKMNIAKEQIDDALRRVRKLVGDNKLFG